MLHLLALGLAVLFTNFGFWQLRRLAQRQVHNTFLEQRLQQSSEPLETLLSLYGADSDPSSLAFRPAKLAGIYDPAEELLLRTASNYNGQAGYYVLTPLKLSAEKAILVKRGWVPFDLHTPPISEAGPVSGRVELEGVLLEPSKRPSGFLASLTPQDPAGKLSITAYTDTTRLEQQMPYTLLPLVLDLRKQSPEQVLDLPLANPAYELSEGSHLAYAIQWFAFVFIGVVGYIALLLGLARTRAKS